MPRLSERLWLAMFTTKEAAKLAKVQYRNWLYHARDAGVRPVRIVGRSSLWDQRAVDAVKAKRKEGVK